MPHPVVEALLRDSPPEESDAARRAQVAATLGSLEDPTAVLALWDALCAALGDVLRQRRDHRGYRGTGRLRGHELSDLTLALELVLDAAAGLRFERAEVSRGLGAGATRRAVDEEARGSVWRTRLLLGGAGASALAFGVLLAFDLTAWLPLAFAGASLLPAAELSARVLDKLPKKRGEAMRRHREERWLRPEEIRRWLEGRRDDALDHALGAERAAAEPVVAHVRARVSIASEPPETGPTPTDPIETVRTEMGRTETDPIETANTGQTDLEQEVGG